MFEGEVDRVKANALRVFARGAYGSIACTISAI